MAYFIYSLVIFIAIILLLINRNYLLYFFVLLYPILPEYLAINITNALPLMTASRVLLIILIISLLITKRKIKLLNKSEIKKSLIIFFLSETLVFFAHINDVDTIKSYVNVILENLILLIVIFNLVDNHEKLDNCLIALCIGAAVVFSFGIFEPIMKFNVSTIFLNTNSRDTLLISEYERYGSVRAVFSFGHAIALAVYCAGMLPIIMYKMTVTKKMKYYLLYEMGFVCMLMTMSRGVIIAYSIVVIFSLFFVTTEERRKLIRLIRNTVLIGLFSVLAIPEMFEIAKNVVLSSLNALGTHFEVSTSSGNEDAILSRSSQLTMIPQVLSKYPLFGGGTGYIRKNVIYVYTASRSFKAKSIDIQYLSWLINKGIVGFIGNIVLYITILKKSWLKIKGDFLNRTFFLVFISIFLSYFTVAEITTDKFLWIIISIYLCYINIKENIEEKS